MAKKGWLGNLWGKVKKGVTTAVGVVGNIIFPGAGTAASTLLNAIPAPQQEAMKEKIIEQGVVKADKVAETLAQYGVQASASNISTVVAGLETAVNQMKVAGGLQADIKVDTSKVDTKTTFLTIIKKWWWAFAIGVVSVIGGIILLTRGGEKRRY